MEEDSRRTAVLERLAAKLQVKGEHPAMLTDEEIHKHLEERGYDVPLMVIRTWVHREHYSVKRNTFAVEKWLLYRPSPLGGRPPKFPQFLAAFDRDINQRMAYQQQVESNAMRLPR